MIEQHSNPFYTDNICYPGTTSLYYQNLIPLLGLMSIPLQWFLSIQVIYNLLVIASFMLSGIGMYLLARRITGNEYAGLLGGILFAFSPIRFEWMNLGWLNVLSCQWIPFYIYFLLRSLDECKKRDILLAGGFLAASGLTHLEFLIFGGLITLILVLHRLLVFRDIRGVLMVTSKVFMVFFILSSPVLVPTIMEGMRETYPRTLILDVGYNSPDAIGIFIPSDHNLLFKESIGFFYERLSTTRGYVQVSYLGFVLILYAIYGVLSGDIKKNLPWIIASILFYLISLGPIIHVFGQDSGLPSIYPLFRQLPFTSYMRFIGRFTLMLQLSLAVLASIGFASVTRGLNKGQVALIFLATTTIFLSEAAIPVEMKEGLGGSSQGYNLPQDAVILNLPSNSKETKMMATLTGGRYVNCYMQRKPKDHVESVMLERIRPTFKRLHYPWKDWNDTVVLADSGLLRSNGVGYITVVKGSYHDRVDELSAHLERMGAVKLHESGQVMIYGLP
ncbi:hypothetical protein ACFLRF_05860 [Candidatus Altiarchaeota archaeon]